MCTPAAVTRTRWRLVLALLLAPAAGVAQRPARDTLDIGFEDAAAPWSQPDGTGFANDLVIAALRAEGIAVRKHVLPYARCKQLVLRGELVACTSMSPERGLTNRVRFSRRTLFVFTCSFFERRDQPLPGAITALEPGTRVGIVFGYEYPPEMMRVLRQRGARLEPAPSEEANLRKLARGRLDAAVVNRDDIKSPHWVAANAGVLGRVALAFTGGTLPAYIGFSLAHPDGLAMAERFDRGFDRIIASGEAARIRQQWIARSAARAP